MSRTGRLGCVRTPLPLVYVELTNICDFNCAFCPKELMTRPPQHMDAALARSALDQIAAGGVTDLVYFHVMGEPALHPDFASIADHAASLGLRVGLTSNGAQLAPGGRIGAMLLDRDLAEINISLQTPDARSFVLRRAKGMDYPAYEAGIMDFFRAHRSRHHETIFRFRFLNTRHAPPGLRARGVSILDTAAELRSALKRWAAMVHEAANADAAESRRIVRKLGRINSFLWNRIEVWPGVWFETFLAGDWGRAFEDRPVHQAWAGYCPGLREHFAVLASGDLVLCCLDYDGKTAVGNLEKQSLEEILSSKKVARIMRGFRRLKPVLPYCKRCQGSASRLGWLLRPLGLLLALKVMKPVFQKTTRLARRS